MCCRAPPLLTVCSPPAARSRTQRSEGNPQRWVPPPNGGHGRQAPRTDAGTETAEMDHDDCSPGCRARRPHPRE
eukprot:3350091-Prymnesium_polylepis.1